MKADDAINVIKERVEIKTFAVYKNLDNNTYTFASKSIDSNIEMREIKCCDSKYSISGEVSRCYYSVIENKNKLYAEKPFDIYCMPV